MQFLSPNQYGFLSRDKIKSAGKITWLITRCENSFFFIVHLGTLCIFAGVFFAGIFRLLAWMDETLLLFCSAVENALQKRKTILLGSFARKLSAPRDPLWSRLQTSVNTPIFFWGGVGCAPWPELEWTENSQRNVPSKKAINYFIEVEELNKYILTSKRKGLRGKKCKWHNRFVLSAVAVNDLEIYKNNIALNQSYSIPTWRYCYTASIRATCFATHRRTLLEIVAESRTKLSSPERFQQLVSQWRSATICPRNCTV